jgi:hypothetical protein
MRIIYGIIFISSSGYFSEWTGIYNFSAPERRLKYFTIASARFEAS